MEARPLDPQPLAGKQGKQGLKVGRPRGPREGRGEGQRRGNLSNRSRQSGFSGLIRWYVGVLRVASPTQDSPGFRRAYDHAEALEDLPHGEVSIAVGPGRGGLSELP